MQKMTWLALGALVIGLGPASAQPVQAAADNPNYQPFTISADASTLGGGISASWRFHDHFGVRGGVNYFSHSEDGEEISGVVYNSKLRLLSEPIGVDIYPWANRSIRLTVGAIINQNRFTGVSPQQAPGALSVPLGNSGGIDSAAIGDISLKVEQEVFSPYIGIGASWYLDKAKRWALGGEIGVAYTGEPDVTLTRSNGPDAIDAQMAIERQQLEDEFDKYTFYPVVKVSLSFSF